MNANLQISELRRSGRDLNRFLRLPYDIYRGDPHWVAPLLADLKKVFLPTNPLFEHADMRLWIATRDGKDVGRIAGIIDRNHLAQHKDGAGFWGFFESIDDQAVSEALFAVCEEWVVSQGCQKLLGPMNPTTNDECGLLVEGFDSRPVLMMTYNPRYYVNLVERAGFTKAKDLLAYNIAVDPKPLERMTKIANGVARRNPKIKITPIRKKTLHADLEKVKAVYNAAWEDNWGFVPMTDAELGFMAERLKPMLTEDLALIAEDDGVPVGFMLCLLDYNEAIQPMRGRILTPRLWGLMRMLMGWKVPQRVRLVTLGLLKSHRQRGIDAMFFAHCVQKGLELGIKECEISWMLEDNVMVLRPIEVFGGEKYKTYRLYERSAATQSAGV